MADVVEVNTTTGRITERDFTADEQKQRVKDIAEAKKQEAEDEAKADQREADIAKVKDRAKTDPDFAALVRLMGL